MVEVPRARLGLLPTAGVLTSLGTLRGLAVRAGVLNLGHALHGSCWKQIQPLWGLKGGWEAAGGRVFSPAERELRKTTHCPPALLSGTQGGPAGGGDGSPGGEGPASPGQTQRPHRPLLGWLPLVRPSCLHPGKEEVVRSSKREPSKRTCPNSYHPLPSREKGPPVQLALYFWEPPTQGSRGKTEPALTPQ